MWYQEVDADQKQIVDKIVIEDCRFMGLNSGGSGLFGLSTKKDAPIHAFEFRNSTFHANDMTKALITGVSSMKGNLDIVVENCTFVAMKAGMTFFDLNAKNITDGSVTIKNNLFSGEVDADNGTWFSFHKNITTRTFENNYITNGFALKNWGVEEDEKPIETVLPMNELFEDVSNRNFTIKDKSSEVYIQGIGDPYWRK